MTELTLDQQVVAATKLIADSIRQERTAHRQIGLPHNQPVPEPVADSGYLPPETDEDRQRRQELVRNTEAQAARMAEFERMRSGT